MNKSVSTVYRAYVELEFMGLIEARPKLGYYVKTRSPLRVDPEPSISLPVYSAEKDLSDYADEIRFAIKQPAFVPLGQATLSPDMLPQRGFVLWIRLPRNTNSLRLYQDALARGITVLPGFLCSYSHNYKRYIRINCGFPFDSNIQNAIERLGRLAAAQTSEE